MNDIAHRVLEELVREGRADAQTLDIASSILSIVHYEVARPWSKEPLMLDNVQYDLEQIKDAHHSLHNMAVSLRQRK